jgi:hypothetical protein
MVGLIGIAVIVLIVIFSIFYGYGLFLKRETTGDLSGPRAKCTICGKTFEKEEMVERAIGIEKLYYFCGECINALHIDYLNKKTNKS